MIFGGVSIRLLIIAGIVLGVGLISLKTIQYIRKAEQDRIQVEQNEKDQEIRERAKDVLRNPPSSSGDAVEWLLERQRSTVQ